MPDDPQMQQYFDNAWQAGTLIRPATAVTMLQNAPGDFLRKYPIVNTFDCMRHGPTQAYISNGSDQAKRPGSKLGTLSMKSTQAFNIAMVSGANSYGTPFQVMGIYTKPSGSDVVWEVLDNTGPAIMLTAKLTGCTFAVRAGGTPGSALVTHVQPYQESGLQVNTRMKQDSDIAYGRLDYDLDTRSVNIVGVRLGGAWQIWVQKLEKNASAPTILSCKRLWPR